MKNLILLPILFIILLSCESRHDKYKTIARSIEINGEMDNPTNSLGQYFQYDTVIIYDSITNSPHKYLQVKTSTRGQLNSVYNTVYMFDTIWLAYIGLE